MTCTIFDLSGPPHSGKTTIAMAIALGLPASIEHVYGVQTSSRAAFLNRRHRGINATGQKITAATLGENVRVVVIDDAHGRYSGPDIDHIADTLNSLHDGPTQLIIIRN